MNSNSSSNWHYLSSLLTTLSYSIIRRKLLAFIILALFTLLMYIMMRNGPPHRQESEMEHLYKMYMMKIQFQCPKVIEIGKGDGAKFTCPSQQFTLLNGCIVYSFGIANDFSFDDDISQRYGCQVFAFDPSMGKNDHEHSPKVRFFNMGLGGTDSDDYVPPLNVYVQTKQTWKIRTLGSVMKMLGHSQKTIDVLKLDIEGSEFAVLIDSMKSGHLKKVKQLLIEYHIYDKDTFADKVKVLADLEQYGFRAFYTDVNILCRPPSCLYVNNVNYVNTLYVA